jgi:hypothetical protein
MTAKTAPSNKRCSIVEIDAYCQHNKPAPALVNRAAASVQEFILARLKVAPSQDSEDKDPHRYASGGELDIVPDGASHKVVKGKEGGLFERSTEQGSSGSTDNVTFKAVMHQGSGTHPIWLVKDEDTGGIVATEYGPDATIPFSPPVVKKSDVPNFMNVWWLKNVRPKRYRVETESCSGPGGSLSIVVYPNIKSGFKTNLIKKAPPLATWEKAIEEYRKAIKTLFDIIKECFPNVKELECKLLEGSVEFENSWSEGRSNEAVWTASAKVGFDPILQIGVKISVLPLNVPAAIAKYCDVFISG